MYRKIVTILIFSVSLICIHSIKAQFLAYEGFDYFNAAAVTLNNANTTSALNEATSLGWRTDWTVSGAATGYTISPNESPVYLRAGRSLITAGKYVTGGGGNTAGRFLQYSTAGFFNNNLYNGGTNYLVDNHAANNVASANGWQITTSNPQSFIGRNGTTIWMSCMLRKDVNNNEPVFVSLHKNANSTDVTTGNRIEIGYFGTASNSGVDKRWSLRLNGTVTQGNVGATINVGNTITNFDLLVVRIDFNSTGGNRVRLYVNPPSLTATPTENANAITGNVDNTIRAVAYFGGTSANQSALDEIRFAVSYNLAVNSSNVIQTVGGLCSGSYGNNIFVNGDFGTTNVTALQPDEYLASTAKAFWSNPTRVVFKTNTAPWNALSPSYTYFNDASRANGQGPYDGELTIVSGVRNQFGGIGATNFWITIEDRSGSVGNQRGFMMVANADYTPNLIFYQETVNALCEGTKYEFSAEVINLYSRPIASLTYPTGLSTTNFPRCNPTTEPGCQQLRTPASSATPSANSSGGDAGKIRYSVLPDVEFLINGVVVYSVPQPVDNDEVWDRVGFTFTTLPGVTALTLAVRNKAPGGIGNDVGLDNISFRPCGPSTQLTGNDPNCNPPTVFATVGSEFNTPVYQWQYSQDGGTTWQNITGATGQNYILTTPVQETDNIRFLVANSPTNLASALCRIVSVARPLACTPLPVRFVSFTGEEIKEGAKLEWKTSSEYNNEKFVVERSTGDEANFKAIGEVAGNGNSTSTNAYQFIDREANLGKNYYRLRQIDYTGEFAYTPVVLVDVKNANSEVKIYPNPAKDFIAIDFVTPSKRTLLITNAIGQVLKSVENNSAKTEISLKGFSKGIYFIEIIENENRVSRTKFVVE